MEEKLSPVAQSGIHLTIFVNIWRYHPGAGGMVQVKYCALPDVDVEANVFLTSMFDIY